jgi:outer membrane protein W
MKKSKAIVLIPILVLVTLLLSLATSALAQEPTAAGEEPAVEKPRVRDWSLRFGFVIAENNGETSVVVNPGTVEVRLSGGGGAFVSLERKITPLLGLEFGLTGIGTDMNVSAGGGCKHWGTGVDVLTMGALTLGANFHFGTAESIDVYAGPMVSFNRYGKWSIFTGADHDGWWPDRHDDDWVSVDSRTDSEFTWGAKAGIDVFLNKKRSWTISGSLSFIDATYDFEEAPGEGRTSIDLDPIMFSFGVGYRF